MFINYLKIHYSNIFKSRYFLIASILEVVFELQYALLFYLIGISDVFTEFAMEVDTYQIQYMVLGIKFMVTPLIGALPIALIAAISSSSYFADRYYINYENTLKNTTIYCISEFAALVSISLIYLAFDAVISVIMAFAVSEPLLLAGNPVQFGNVLLHIFTTNVEGIVIGLIAGKLFRVNWKSVLAAILVGPLEVFIYSMVYTVTVTFGKFYHISSDELAVICINVCSTLFPNYYYCAVNFRLKSGGNTSNLRLLILFFAYVIFLGLPIVTLLHKRKKEIKKK